MGFFTQMLAGGLSGFGQGIAQVGAQRGQALDASELQRQRDEEWIRRQEMKGDQNEEAIRLRAELAAGRAGSNRGSGGVTGVLADNGIDLPTLATIQGGGSVSRADIDATLRNAKGEDITAPTQLPGPPTEDGQTPGMKPSPYTSGSAKAMLEKSAVAFNKAFAIQAGGKADDIAKAVGEFQTQDITSGVLAGSNGPKAAEAVAAGKGVGAFAHGDRNQFTGDPNAVGQSAIRENNAQAGAAGALAGKYGAERDRVVKGKDDLPALTSLRISTVAEVASAQKALHDFDSAAKEMRPSERAARAGEREALVAAVANTQKRLSDVTDRISFVMDQKQAEKGGKPDKATEKPAAEKGPDMAAANAIKADLAAGKITREQALSKLRALGFK